jgi:hypothetical protein
MRNFLRYFMSTLNNIKYDEELNYDELINQIDNKLINCSEFNEE